MVVRDDAVSGEPDQLYDLELQNIPADVMLSQGTATIVIDDNDRKNNWKGLILSCNDASCSF